MRWVIGFWMSLGMFSSLPVPKQWAWSETARPLIIPNLPVVGLVHGLLSGLAAWGLIRLHVPPVLSALLTLLILHGLTGLIHDDGLMDTADALFSRAPLEKRLAILKDPHVGSFAVLAILLVMLSQYAALQVSFAVATTGRSRFSFMLLLLLIHVLSRAIVSLAVLSTPGVITNGYAKSFREGTTWRHRLLPLLALITSLTGAVIWSVAGGAWGASLVLLAEILAGALAYRSVFREFHGISGDLAGFILVISETAALLATALAMTLQCI